MVLEQHLGRARELRLAVGAHVEREAVHVGVVALDELLNEEVAGKAILAQGRPQAVELGLLVDEVDLLEAMGHVRGVLARAGGLGHEREGDGAGGNLAVAREVNNLGEGRVEPVLAAELGKRDLVGDLVDDVGIGDGRDAVGREAATAVREDLDEGVGVAYDHAGLLGIGLGNLGHDAGDLFLAQAFDGVNVQNLRVGNGRDGRGGEHLGLHVVGLVELAGQGVGANVAAQHDGHEVLAGLFGLGGRGLLGLAVAQALGGGEGMVEALVQGHVAIGRHGGDLLGKLGLELVEAQELGREVAADGHHVVVEAALVGAKVAALEVDELVGDVLAHRLVEARAVVAHGARVVDGDDRPRHNAAPLVAAGVDAAVLGPQQANHVLVVALRSGAKAVALGGLDHDGVVLREVRGGVVGLVGAGHGALAQGLAHVAAPARLHAGQNLVIAACDVNHDGVVVGNAREYGLGARQLVENRDAHELLLAVAVAHVGGQGVDRGGLGGLAGLLGPDGRMVGAQVVVAVRLVVDEADEREGAAVLLEGNAAPGRATLDGCLVGGPGGRLFDG